MKMADTFKLPISSDYNLSDKDGIFAYDLDNDDAKAIALCVNNHDKLVEALRQIASGEWSLTTCIETAIEVLDQ